MLAQTITDDKPHCEKCFNKGYHVDVDSLGKIFTECCPNTKTSQRDAYCNIVNWEKIDPENKEEQAKLRNKNLPADLLSVLREFIINWPKIKKQKTHYDMVKNPENYNIVRPIKEHQFTTMHLLTRNQVFQIISKKDRSKLIEVDQFNKELDSVSNRTFLGWGGKVHFKVTGPVLCTYDESVYDACNKLWHENDTKGIELETNLAEIWRKMGNTSSMGGCSINSLKRSLNRLVDVSVTASSMENKNFWAGGIIDSVIYKGSSNKKTHQVIISFNKHMIYQYLGGLYATLDHCKYNKLTPYAKKIYSFLMSHEDTNRKMGLDKWKNTLGVKESLQDKEFRRQMREAINELKEARILLPESMIDRSGFVVTYISSEAWNPRTDSPNF